MILLDLSGNRIIDCFGKAELLECCKKPKHKPPNKYSGRGKYLPQTVSKQGHYIAA